MYIGKVIRYSFPNKNLRIYEGVNDVFLVEVPLRILSASFNIIPGGYAEISVPFGHNYIRISVGNFVKSSRALEVEKALSQIAFVKMNSFEFKKTDRIDSVMVYHTLLFTEIDSHFHYFLWIDRYDRVFLEAFDTGIGDERINIQNKLKMILGGL